MFSVNVLYDSILIEFKKFNYKEIYMLREISQSIGVTGYEFNISKLIEELLGDSNFEHSKDNIGNLIYYKKGTGNIKKKILISAHMDEVGLQINNVSDRKKLKFKTLGNIHSYNLYQQRVKFANGCIGIILGENPLKLEKYNYDNLYITLLNELDVEIGDICTFDSVFIENSELIIGKALDNRVGCYILMKIIETISEANDDLYCVFTVQEEFGLKGMKVALNSINPDVVIVIDTVPEDKKTNIICGNGIAIKISDSISICNHDIVNALKYIAKEKNIQYQLEVTDSGATEVALVTESGLGIKCGAISIPIINMHTANSMVNKEDICNAIQLLREFVFTTKS